MSEKIVQLNEEIIKGQLKELVRGSVEETLNELLEKRYTVVTQTVFAVCHSLRYWPPTSARLMIL